MVGMRKVLLMSDVSGCPDFQREHDWVPKERTGQLLSRSSPGRAGTPTLAVAWIDPTGLDDWFCSWRVGAWSSWGFNTGA